MTADPSVHRLEIPTPFAIGPVNVYLVEDDPVTLIDCGPAWTPALDALEDGIAAHGLALGDIGLLLVTHQHSDHVGLAHTIARRTEAEIACIEPLAALGRDAYGFVQEEHATAAALMRRHGVPPDIVDTLEAATRPIWRFGPPFTADRALRNGDRVELRDRTLDVLHRPGHSPTDTVFVDHGRRVLFSGDHLLAGTSSNGLVTSRPPGTPQRDRYPALRDYAASLRRTRTLDVDVVHGGHGADIDDHRALIDKRLAQHDSRCARLLELVRESPRSVHDLAVALWGRKARAQALLTTSEVLGHLDLLVDQGVVREVLDGDLAVWEEV